MGAKFKPDEIAKHKNNILSEISDNGLSLRKTLLLEGFPSIPTVLDWLKTDSEFAIQYARACEIRADKIADEIIDICDATADDIILDVEGNQITNHNVIQRDRLRVDTRKWLLGKLAPKKYGDKVDITTDGEKINNMSTLVLPKFMEKGKK